MMWKMKRLVSTCFVSILTLTLFSTTKLGALLLSDNISMVGVGIIITFQAVAKGKEKQHWCKVNVRNA